MKVNNKINDIDLCVKNNFDKGYKTEEELLQDAKKSSVLYIEVNVSEFRKHIGRYMKVIETGTEIRLIKYGRWICSLIPAERFRKKKF